MKATEILEWICRESINGEFLNIVDIPADVEDLNAWMIGYFGAKPSTRIEAGRYMYFYVSSVGSSWGEDYMYPDAQIELDNDYINLYKVED